MAVDKELFKGCSKAVVLQLLAKKKMHGYEISSKLKELSGGEIEITEGTLYPMLHGLESAGDIISSWEVSKGGRKKKVYQLTEAGREALKIRKQEWSHFLSTMKLLLPVKMEADYAYSL